MIIVSLFHKAQALKTIMKDLKLKSQNSSIIYVFFYIFKLIKFVFLLLLFVLFVCMELYDSGFDAFSILFTMDVQITAILNTVTRILFPFSFQQSFTMKCLLPWVSFKTTYFEIFFIQNCVMFSSRLIHEFPLLIEIKLQGRKPGLRIRSRLFLIDLVLKMDRPFLRVSDLCPEILSILRT